MQKQRVLILQSIEDNCTHHRMARMQQSPLLNGYMFQNCYVIEITEEQKTLPTDMMMDEVVANELNQTDLLKRLETSVREFDPHILLVHYGFAFDSFTVEVLNALNSLKAKYPMLIIGLENIFSLPNSLQQFQILFESNGEIDMLLGEIF